MFNLLFTPIGRYAAIAMLVIGLTGCVIYKIRADAVAELQAAAMSDALKRTENAIRSGDSLDLSSDRLRENDSNERK